MNSRLCKYYENIFKTGIDLIYYINIYLIRRDLTRKRILRKKIFIASRKYNHERLKIYIQKKKFATNINIKQNF